jgi:hypothetical protein
MADINSLKARMLELQYNPAGLQRLVINNLADLDTVPDGSISVVDASNPFVYAIESATVLTSAFMSKNEANTRKQYPFSAQTVEDLYLHMSDRDYVGRFATPSKATFELLLGKDEVLEKMVLDPSTGYRKLVLPRNTFFTVADTVFSLQYPIEIRQLAHGGLQVVYDAEQASPLQTLTSNLVKREIRKSAEGEWIHLEFETQQFKITQQTGSLSSATDFKLDIALEDQFYYARVYVENAAGAWKEIRTTHSEQIYDAAVPTATLKVVGNVLTMRIPQIYITSGLLNRNVRVDTYQTKGALELLLENYPLGSYTATWQAYDKSEQTVFTAPLTTLRQAMPYSTDITKGGANGVSLPVLRQQVITNAIGSPQIPITNVQIVSELSSSGYDIVKNVDSITDRVFLATRAMPTPLDENLITAAASSIEMVSLSLEEAASLRTVVDNGDSITLTPDTLYRLHKGITQIVPSALVDSVLALPADQRALAVTSGNFLYTPWHYVLDATRDEFSCRAYYLDSPSAPTLQFIAENDTTLLQVSTGAYTVVRTPTGYSLRVVTKSSDEYKALDDDVVFAQLAFVPQGEQDRAYLTGALVHVNEDLERVFSFDLSTSFNLDAKHLLELTKFFLYTTENRLSKTPLTEDFEIIFATSAQMPSTWRAGTIDSVLGRFLLPPQVYGLSQEKVRINFGYALDKLWSRARSVVSSITYKKWDVNVPLLYLKDVYALDPVTGSSVQIDAQGNVSYQLLHAAGSPVLTPKGVPIIQHAVGDVMLDNNDQPIALNPRGMLRQVEIMLIDGNYKFATDTTTLGYRSTLISTVLSWITSDLTSMSKRLLEQTRLYFYPKTTMGDIQAMVLDGLVVTVPAAQSLVVSLYVSKEVFSNDEIRRQLQIASIQTLNEVLKKTQISISEAVSLMRTRYGRDVIDVRVTGLGGAANYQAMTVLDDGDRCSIRKRLVALADDTLVVQEDVVVDFIRHELIE